MYPADPLMVMAKLPRSPAESASNLIQTDRSRVADLLHMTLLGLWGEDGQRCVTVPDLCDLLDTFRMQPFDVVFDLVRRSGKHVELVSSRPLAEAITLRQFLIDHLIDRAGVPLKRPSKLRPHVTLHYNSPGEPLKEFINPIRWRVEEILLIESVTGQTRHNTYGRWPLLKGDGSAYEYGLPLFRT